MLYAEIIAVDCKKIMAHINAVWTNFIMFNIISGSIQVYTIHQGLKDYYILNLWCEE